MVPFARIQSYSSQRLQTVDIHSVLPEMPAAPTEHIAKCYRSGSLLVEPDWDAPKESLRHVAAPHVGIAALFRKANGPVLPSVHRTCSQLSLIHI